MDKPDLNELQQFVKEYSFPTDILIETIAKCNLKCIMCPQKMLTRETGKMPFELWEKIIDEIAEKSPSTKIWPALMGEPLLLQNEIFRMMRYAKDKGIQHISMNTNLIAFKKDMINAFFESRFDEMIVGIDGFTADTYAKIRSNGNLEVLLENLFFIINEKEKRGLSYPIITLQYIVMDENEHEEQLFINYWKKLGKDIRLKIKARTGWANAVKPWANIINVSQKDRFMPCTWLLRQMTIFWDGSVPQCDGDYDGNTNFGNVNISSIEDIWNAGLNKVRDKHMNLNFNFSPCNKCEDWQAGKSKILNCRDL